MIEMLTTPISIKPITIIVFLAVDIAVTIWRTNK